MILNLATRKGKSKSHKVRVRDLHGRTVSVSKTHNSILLGTDGSNAGSFFSSWGLTSLSSAVTSKGLELVSEGIGALETIGKKTMDVISEGDPGFRVKREMFKKPSLSQVCFESIKRQLFQYD